MEEKRKQIIEITGNLLNKKGIDTGSGLPEIEVLAGDGSQRQFFRLHFDNNLSLVAIVPAAEQKQGMEEAYSSWSIGNHLYGKGVPVPELLGFDPESGCILTEDLGDTRLHGYIREKETKDEAETYQIYRQVVQELVKMQVLGSKDFDDSWCWQTKKYDRQLMLERESDYFIDAFCTHYLEIDAQSPELQAEFERIAEQASQAPSGFFLHRDFQSRNIMLKDDKVRFIDYQGGRCGPLGYDLASLLIDPYVVLPHEMQDDLLAVYMTELNKYIQYEADSFRWEYLHLAMQRNLQILGAFAFLGKLRGKDFFLPFISPALSSLQELLKNLNYNAYPALASLVNMCIEKNRERDI